MGVMAVRLAGGEVVIIIRSSCCLLSRLSQHFMLGLCKFLGDLGALVMVQSWHYWLDPTKTRSREPGNASSWLQVSSLENVEFDEKQFKNFSIFRNQALRSGEEESGSDDCISEVQVECEVCHVTPVLPPAEEAGVCLETAGRQQSTLLTANIHQTFISISESKYRNCTISQSVAQKPFSEYHRKLLVIMDSFAILRHLALFIYESQPDNL